MAVSPAYVWRLESAGAAPGIDLLGRLTAIGTTPTDLLPSGIPPDTVAMLRGQTRQLFDHLLEVTDRETLLVLNPLLARMIESQPAES